MSLLDPLEYRHSVRRISDSEVLFNSNVASVRAQISPGYRMKRAENELLLQTLPDKSTDSSLHLLRRLYRKGTHDDVPWSIALVADQICHSRCQCFGFAGSGRSEDLEDGRRTGDGAALGIVEAGEDMLHTAMSGWTPKERFVICLTSTLAGCIVRVKRWTRVKNAPRIREREST